MNIAACYLLAYGIAKPVVRFLLRLFYDIVNSRYISLSQSSWYFTMETQPSRNVMTCIYLICLCIHKSEKSDGCGMPRVQHKQGQKKALWEKIIKTMQSLYIIGNGFDSYGHNMPTQYSDFRQYLVNRFPEYQRDYGGTLEFTVQNDGSELYDMNEVVGAIIRTIDECSKPGWGNLEECLGTDFLCAIAYENEWAFVEPQFDDDDDNSIFHSVYSNEDLSNSIVGAYEMLMKLFVDWVHHGLGEIDYSNIEKLRKKPSFKNSLFLNFNYTRTIEQVYGIKASDICHIHGEVYSRTEGIYFGHGDDEEFEGFDEYIGITDAFSSLKRLLRKDTRTALKHSKGFFDRLSKVNKIYSYGFSFSEVDMPYIEEIAKIVVPRQTRWYFNKYDMENNKEYIEMVKNLGFKVRKCKRW